MRIIKPGDSEARKPWWARMAWLCSECGCIFATERGDRVDVHSAGMTEQASCACPTCGATVVAQRERNDRLPVVPPPYPKWPWPARPPGRPWRDITWCVATGAIGGRR